ncbi:hypothetical protein HY946_02140 [Candidatus Gottesmanbacteria bacterium]|nr:hypothetical protein [Candidatus Gottesmanbacteria bacterium]
MPNGLTPVVAKLVGGATSSSWAQVFLSESQSFEPQLFFTLALVNQSDADTATIGKDMAQNFLQNFSSHKDKPWESLKESLEQLVSQAKEKNVIPDVSCGVLFHGCLYAGTFGEAKIFFRRRKKFTQLLNGEKETTKTISGFLEEHDLLILSSFGFANLISRETLFDNLDHKPLEEVVEALSPIVLGSPDSSLSAALFVEFKRNTVPVIEQIEKEQDQPKVALQENQILKKIKNLGSKFSLPVLSNILMPSWKKRLPETSDKLSFSQTRSKKTMLTVAVVILGLLLISVVFGIKKQQDEKDHAVFTKFYDESKSKIDEGKAIIDLNPTLARSLLTDGKKEVNLGKNQLKNKNSSDYKTILALSKEADDLLASVSRAYKIASPDLFYDLSLLKDKAIGLKMGLYKTSLAILDTTNTSIYSLGTDNKSADVVAGGQSVFGPQLISIHADKIHVLSTANGIVEIGVKDKIAKTVVKSDKDWGEVRSLVDFATNVYLLDAKKGQIIKYVNTDNGFGEARNYLRPDVTPDFSQSVSMAIDGSIWILNAKGLISKFTQGRPDNFNISGLDIGFSSPQAIFTSDDAKNIYVLDSGNNRVVVLAKNGDYVSQYQWSGMNKATDMVANEALGKILLLSGSKIYSLSIKP